MLPFIPKFDLILTFSTLLLLALGITILSSVAPELLPVQLIAAGIGLATFWLMSETNYQLWPPLSKWLYPFCLIVLILPFIFGLAAGGAHRWLQLGPVSIQPSELVRPFLLIMIAHVLADTHELTLAKILKSAILLAIPTYIIWRQPDLGLAMTLLAGWAGMLLSKGLSTRQLVVGLLIIAIGLPLSWNFLHDYQKNRVLTFLNPGRDPLNTGYHVLQSQIAVGSGQLWGRGLGRGSQSHLKFLPERHTDFVFAALAEELGLIGSLLVLTLYLGLFSRLIHVVNRTENATARLIVAGFLGTLSFQMFVNIGMNLGLLPVTGVTLPLLSYGGSSLVATFISLGILNNILIQSQTSKENLYIH